MRATMIDHTPGLRCYAHALLARWPAPPRESGAIGADRDADDIVHEALLGFWRVGMRQTAPDNGESLRIALLRRVTDLARSYVTRKAELILASGGLAHETDDASDAPRYFAPLSHFSWAPEAFALPRLTLELRALLALVSIERLTYAQAAAVLDMPAQRALTRLAFARAQLASAMYGEARPHLQALPGAEAPNAVNDGELHRYADEMLESRRRAEVAALAEADPAIARRVAELRRQSERLRRAFAPLRREPLPLQLDFTPPERSESLSRSLRGRALSRLISLLAPPAAPAAPDLYLF